MTNANALLHRRDVVNELVRDRRDLLVIAGLGAPNWDVSAAGDHPNNFPLWGAMGGASMMGARAGAGAAQTPGARHHRRRRDVDEYRLARVNRGGSPEEPHDRGAR